MVRKRGRHRKLGLFESRARKRKPGRMFAAVAADKQVPKDDSQPVRVQLRAPRRRRKRVAAGARKQEDSKADRNWVGRELDCWRSRRFRQAGAAFSRRDAQTPVVGERVDVLTTEQEWWLSIRQPPDPALLPEPIANTEWAQAGGNATKSMGHLALGQSLGPGLGSLDRPGSSVKGRLAAAPVVAKGRSSRSTRSDRSEAFDARTVASSGAVEFGVEKDNRACLFGGGVAVDSGRV